MFFDGTQEIILLDPPKELVFTNDDIVFQRGISVPGGSIQLEGWESSLSERLSRHFLEPPNVRTHIYSRLVDFINLKVSVDLRRLKLQLRIQRGMLSSIVPSYQKQE